ncbi:MAG: hypothetical protein NTW54_05820 [Bacteroidetes bacterium]|nr:hypothetical protein [Bacteroidota bacterium]
MKFKIYIVLVCCLLATGLTGCFKDVLDPGDPDAPAMPVSFSAELIPLFTTKCAASGCHDAIPTHKPSLTAANAYNDIKNGGFIDVNVPASSTLYGLVKSGEMPSTGPLKVKDVQKIYDWIRNGAPNN